MPEIIPEKAGRISIKVSCESNTGSLSSCKSLLYAKGKALRVARSPVKFPINLPVLPLANSAASGFFF